MSYALTACFSDKEKGNERLYRGERERVKEKRERELRRKGRERKTPFSKFVASVSIVLRHEIGLTMSKLDGCTVKS